MSLIDGHSSLGLRSTTAVLFQIKMSVCIVSLLVTKGPPAAHKLLLLKGVARIQASVKMKSPPHCFPAAVQLGHNV